VACCTVGSSLVTGLRWCCAAIASATPCALALPSLFRCLLLHSARTDRRRGRPPGARKRPRAEWIRRRAPMRHLIAAFLLAFATVVTAHTPLTASVPAAKATVPAPVKEIVLEFGGDVRLTAVVLTDAAAAQRKVAPVPTAVASKFTLAIEEALR